jgi:hypothetical protein
MWPLLIAGGMSLLNGWLQSRASKKAAETQSKSADKALALGHDVYAQQRADQLPWLSAGQGAVNQLSSLMGINTANTPAMLSQPTGPRMAEPRDPGAPGGQHGAVTPGGYQQNPLASMRSAGSSSTPAAQAAMVTLMAPDGSIQRLPAQFAAHYEALGARRVA